MYGSYGGQLWRALLVVAGGRGEVAREATAEAFARLVANADSVREPRAWLYRTGYRLVLDELRRERRTREDLSDLSDLAARGDADVLFSAELCELLERLSPPQRLVVFLTYHAGMSLREVAEVTGSPVATVKVRLHRARGALRMMLDESEGADVNA